MRIPKTSSSEKKKKERKKRWEGLQEGHALKLYIINSKGKQEKPSSSATSLTRSYKKCTVYLYIYINRSECL